MAKGYCIGRIDVHDEDGYKRYAAANPAIFQKFGGRFVMRGGKLESPKASSRARNVVLEFPDHEAALACYRSRDWLPRKRRHAELDLVIVEGYDGPSFGESCLYFFPKSLAIPTVIGRKPMAETMRVVIAGAGGRMGRTLIHAVAASKGLTLVGAVEAPGAAVIGRDAGELAGPGAERHQGDKRRCAAAEAGRRADRIHHSGGHACLHRTDRRRRDGPYHRHHRPFGRGGGDHRTSGEPRHHRQVRQFQLGVNLLAAADQARGQDARTTTTTSRSSKCITTRRSTRPPAPR